MVRALPNEVLHSDWDIAERAYTAVSTSMGSQGALCPCIHCCSRMPSHAAHHSVIYSPVRSSHQREAMLKFLDPPCTLVLLLQM